MAKKKQYQKKTFEKADTPQPESRYFSFGGTERVRNPFERSTVEFDESTGVYTPPVDRDAISKAMTGSSYHGAIVEARTRIVSSFYNETSMPFGDMMNLCKDLIGFGEAYIQIIKNPWGKPVRLAHAQTKYTYRGKNNRFFHRDIDENYHPYRAGEIHQIKLYDVEQNIYGLPDYLSGLSAAMLSEESTKFRRAFFHNGNHVGFILYTTDPNITPEAEAALDSQLKNAKGDKAFSSMHINIPNGIKDGVQVIKIGDIGSKDDFSALKNVTAQEQLVAHRFPGEMAGISPPEGGNMGDPTKFKQTYYENEVLPLHKLITDINKILPKELHLKFETPNDDTNSNN
ncbi:phage portal protein [Vibrio vulnificus]|uniref:phage portal protein n=1 Tax=Vibrio vulnificus TaxID=672 RepID=UPI00102A3A3C|nr:phage portal protein [Vibrio vulnificus]RZP88983.1 phage portal protein [Vibrio vulnificus]